jgi:hypothetical protein
MAALIVAIVVAVLAPIWALAWINQPFPGFVVDPTLVVNGNDGVGWTGRRAGLAYPQRITRLAGVPVHDTSEYGAVLAGYEVGESVSIVATSPDGSGHYYGGIRLMRMSATDLFRLFIVPYLVGVAYVLIGLWVYRMRGGTRPGRALAFFCFSAAVVCIVIFDAVTTHVVAELWTLALALSAGAVVSLAMRFPVEWGQVRRRPWTLSIPYFVALALAAWGVLELVRPSDPWAYARAWEVTYRYIGLSLVTFLAAMLYRALVDPSAAVRKQARVVLIGSVISFTPVALWLLGPLVGLRFPFEPALLLGPLIVFPLSVAVAIVRYRLLDAEMVLNRALLYGALTALLAGLFTGSITLMQKVFIAVTGEESDIAIVLTTLITVSAITPIRTRLQAFLDRHLRKAPLHSEELERFATEARLVAAMAEAGAIGARFLHESVASLNASSGALNVRDGSGWRTAESVGNWTGRVELAVPITSGQDQLAVLLLGPRTDGQAYGQAEADALGAIAPDVGRALRAAWIESEAPRTRRRPRPQPVADPA